jgi:predicted MFS family arabinose efflux permease
VLIAGVLLFFFASLLGGIAQAEWQLLAARALLNVPIGLLIAFGAVRVLSESPRQHGRFDLAGAFTATIGLVSLVYGLTQKGQPDSTWTELGVLGPIAFGVIVLAAFLAIESRSSQPLLPVRIVADRTRGVSFVVMLIVGASMFAMLFFLALYIQQVLGYSPLKSGLAFLPFSAGIIVATQTASVLVSRMDPRWISGVGALLGAGGMLGFAQLDADSTYFGDVLPWILMMPFGLGLVFIPITLTAVSRVEPNESGVGSAVLNTVQQVGAALGLAIRGPGTVRAHRADLRLHAGLHRGRDHACGRWGDHLRRTEHPTPGSGHRRSGFSPRRRLSRSGVQRALVTRGCSDQRSQSGLADIVESTELEAAHRQGSGDLLAARVRQQSIGIRQVTAVIEAERHMALERHEVGELLGEFLGADSPPGGPLLGPHDLDRFGKHLEDQVAYGGGQLLNLLSGGRHRLREGFVVRGPVSVHDASGLCHRRPLRTH